MDIPEAMTDASTSGSLSTTMKWLKHAASTLEGASESFANSTKVMQEQIATTSSDHHGQGEKEQEEARALSIRFHSHMTASLTDMKALCARLSECYESARAQQVKTVDYERERCTELEEAIIERGRNQNQLQAKDEEIRLLKEREAALRKANIALDNKASLYRESLEKFLSVELDVARNTHDHRDKVANLLCATPDELLSPQHTRSCEGTTRHLARTY